MRLETFFKKFDELVGAPDGVEKMRQLVRHLAVSGKLVPQDPNDEAAEVLIARVAALRRAENAKEYEAVSADEVPYEVPFSWSWVRLGNISLNSDSGWSPQCLAEARSGTDWGVLKVSAVSWGIFKPEENKALPPGIASRRDCEVRPGDFLLSRANTEELVARSVVVDETPPRLMMSDKIVRFTFPDEIERSYVNLANTSESSRAYYARNASGTSSSMKNIGREVMCNLPIPLPPLAEQRRIVVRVQNLMALCDRLAAQQKERLTRQAALVRASLARFAEAPTSANLSFLFHPSYDIPPADLRKSILGLAVQGKLAPEIKTRHVTLGEVIELISGQHLLGHEQNELGKGIPYLTGPSDFGTRHPIPTRWTETPKVVAEPGDILITVKGSGVGKTNKLVAERTAISRQLMAARVTGADPDFVHLVLMNAAGHFQESMTGIAIPGIGRKDVLQLEAELPPLTAQHRIVAKVEQLMALVDELETRLAASRATAANLLFAVVAELTQCP